MSGPVLVTGAAGGIGAAVVAELVASGRDVVVADLDVERAEEVLDALPAPGRSLAVALDTTDVASLDAALDQAEAVLGTPTGLVTCAGIIDKQEFLDLDLGDWERTLRINLTGTMLAFQALGRRLVRGGLPGAFVAISSVAGRGGRANAVDYAASKAGVLSLVRSVALALAPHGIRVNGVCPGVVATPMTEAIHDKTARELGLTRQESLRRAAATIPLGRIEEPSEVATAVAFLLGPAASYITGQSLNVCGGLEFD